MLKKFHYSWAICLAGGILIFITIGVVSNSFTIFMPFIMQHCNLTNAQTSSLITVRSCVSLLIMLNIHRFYRILGMRLGLALAAVFGGISFLLYSLAENYVSFCVAAAVGGFCNGLGSMIPVSILINNWFYERRALALGICTIGSGIATIIIPTISTTLIQTASMQVAFRVEAIMIFALAVIIFLIIRGTPSELGLQPYGQQLTQYELEHMEKPVTRRLSRRQWISMTATCFLLGAVGTAGFTHLSVLFTSEGFSAMTVATIFSGIGLMLTVGKLVDGHLIDRIGGHRASIVLVLILLIGNTLCCFAYLQNNLVAAVTVLFLGFGYPLSTIGISIWCNDLVSADQYADTLSRLQVMYSSGGLIFISVPGILADILGGYIPSYMIFSGMLLLVLALMHYSYWLAEQGETAK